MQFVNRIANLHNFYWQAGAAIVGDWFDSIARFIDWSKTAHRPLVYAGNQWQRRGSVDVYGWRDITAATQSLFAHQGRIWG